MKNKVKKIGALFFSLVIMLNNFSFAKDISIEEEVTNSVMTLSEAVEYALEHNPTIVDIKRQVKDQEETYDDAKKTYRNWQYEIESGGYAFETPTDYLDCKGHSLEMAELAYKSFLATKGTAEQTISYNIKKIAYSIDELEKSIELLEKNIKKQEKELKIAELKSRVNMITSIDVTPFKTTVSATKLQLDSLNTTLDSLKVNLKNLMGYDIEKELTVTLPEQEMVNLHIKNLAETIDNSLETNGEAIKAKISYKQKEINNILATETPWLETRDDIKDAKKEFSDAKIRLDNSLNYIKANLHALYTTVKESEESVIIAEKEYREMENNHRKTNVMYQLGMVTMLDLNSMEIGLINARNKYETALHENILLNDRWNIAITIGDVIAAQNTTK